MKSVSRYRRILSALLCGVLFTVLSITYCGAQSKTLNLHFSGKDDTKDVTLRYSIRGLVNYLYEPYLHKVSTDSDQLSIIVPDSISSFFMSVGSPKQYEWGSYTNIYMNDGEQLDIYLDTIQPPRFEGKNPDVYRLVSKVKNGAGYERTDRTMKAFSEYKDSNSFYEFIKTEINSNLSVLDSLDKHEKIEPGFYNYVKGIIMDDYLFRAGMVANMRDKDYELLRNDSISFFRDIDKLYGMYDIDITDELSLTDKASLKGRNLISRAELDLGLDYDNESYIYYIYKQRRTGKSSSF